MKDKNEESFEEYKDLKTVIEELEEVSGKLNNVTVIAV